MGAESSLIETGLWVRESSDFGGTLTYGGVGYPCSVGPTQVGLTNVIGGGAMTKNVIVTVRKTSCPGVTFTGGRTCTLLDKKGTSRSLKIAPGAEGVDDLVYAWQLTLHDPAQGI